MAGAMGLLPSLGGWIFYAFLTSRMALTRRKAMFFVFYLIFCVALILNVIGCKKTLETAAGIQ
jgi:hypothetical protein